MSEVVTVEQVLEELKRQGVQIEGSGVEIKTSTGKGPWIHSKISDGVRLDPNPKSWAEGIRYPSVRRPKQNDTIEKVVEAYKKLVKKVEEYDEACRKKQKEKDAARVKRQEWIFEAMNELGLVGRHSVCGRLVRPYAVEQALGVMFDGSREA